MESNRRHFLKKLILTTGTTYVASNAIAQIPILKDGSTGVDWDQVANQFSLTNDKIYLNNGTLGPSPRIVTEAIQNKMNAVNSTGNYGDSESCRKKLAAFVGANPTEIALTHNTTEGINIFANGLQLKKGQRIILCNHEHAGGAVPWLNKAKIEGLLIDIVELAPQPMETLDRIKKLANAKTKVIAIPHIACTTGHLQPIEEIATWAKTKNIKLIIDGAHGPGLIPLNFNQTNIDYYAGCCHKWMCGPKGTGFIYVRNTALDAITPKFVGAGSDSGWKTNGVTHPMLSSYAEGALRFQYGTQNTALWHGIEATIDFIENIGIENIHRHSNFLCSNFKNGILGMSQYELLTPINQEASAGMVTIRHKSIDYKTLNTKLVKEKIRVRVVPEHDLDAVRFSFHLYNTSNQVDFVLDLLKSI